MQPLDELAEGGGVDGGELDDGVGSRRGGGGGFFVVGEEDCLVGFVFYEGVAVAVRITVRIAVRIAVAISVSSTITTASFTAISILTIIVSLHVGMLEFVDLVFEELGFVVEESDVEVVSDSVVAFADDDSDGLGRGVPVENVSDGRSSDEGGAYWWKEEADAIMGCGFDVWKWCSGLWEMNLVESKCVVVGRTS